MARGTWGGNEVAIPDSRSKIAALDTSGCKGRIEPVQSQHPRTPAHSRFMLEQQQHLSFIAAASDRNRAAEGLSASGRAENHSADAKNILW